MKLQISLPTYLIVRLIKTLVIIIIFATFSWTIIFLWQQFYPTLVGTNKIEIDTDASLNLVPLEKNKLENLIKIINQPPPLQIDNQSQLRNPFIKDIPSQPPAPLPPPDAPLPSINQP